VHTSRARAFVSSHTQATKEAVPLPFVVSEASTRNGRYVRTLVSVLSLGYIFQKSARTTMRFVVTSFFLVKRCIPTIDIRHNIYKYTLCRIVVVDS
jgi:hypothetical protein